MEYQFEIVPDESDPVDFELGVEPPQPDQANDMEFVVIPDDVHYAQAEIPDTNQFDMAVFTENTNTPEETYTSQIKNKFKSGINAEVSPVQDKPDDQLGSSQEVIGGNKEINYASDKMRKDRVSAKAAREKMNSYLLSTGWGESITGKVLMGKPFTEYDEQMEADMTMSDRAMRFVVMMGADFWMLPLGGSLPKVALGAEGAVRSLPMFAKAGGLLTDGTVAKMMASPALAKTLTAGSAMGMYQGEREAYTQKLMQNSDIDPDKYPELAGRGLYDIVSETVKGFAVGAVAGKGQAIRDNMFANATSNLVGSAKYATGLAGESVIISSLMTQLEDPGKLPTVQTFVEGMMTDAMMEAVSFIGPGVGAVRRSAIRDSWYSRKYIKAYNNNGTHPHTLAEDAHSDMSVMEDLSSPFTDRIRRYDEEGGVPQEERSSLHQEVEEAVESSSRPEPVMKDDAASEIDPATGKPDQVQAEPVPLAIPDGVHTPIPLFEGEGIRGVFAPDGRKVILPTSRGRSLAMSKDGVIKVPAVMSLAKSILGRLPKLERMDDGTLGWFGTSERQRSIKMLEMSKRIKSLKRKRATIAKRGQEGSVPVYDSAIKKLEVKLDELNSKEEITPQEAHIAISAEAAKTDGGLLATTLHEVGHLLDYLSAEHSKWGGSTIKEPWVGSHILSYFDNVSDMLQRAGELGVDIRDIQKEAEFISSLWRPGTDAEMASDYRRRSAELTADIVSVRLNNPDILAEWAPNIHKVFDEFVNSRPEIADVMRKTESDIRNGRDIDTVEAQMKEDFSNAEYRLAASHVLSSQESNQLGRSWFTKFLTMGNDKYSGALMAMNKNSAVVNALQRHQYVSTQQGFYMSKMYDSVLSKLGESGIDERDFALVMFYNRIANDATRDSLANAYGFKKETAKEQLDTKLTQVLKDSGVDLAGLLKDVNRVRQETIVPLAKESGLFSDAFLESMSNNESYAKFDVKSYFDERVSAGTVKQAGRGSSVLTSAESRIVEQVGGLGEITNPLSATLTNDLELYDRILKTSARRDAVMAMFEASHERVDVPIIPAEEFRAIAENEPYRFGPYAEETLRKSILSFPERRLQKDGTYKTVRRKFHVPPDVFDAFSSTESSATQQLLAHVSKSTFTGLAKDAVTGKDGVTRAYSAVGTAIKSIQSVNKYFRFMAVVASAKFQSANLLAYDPLRVYMNLPGMSKFMPYAMTVQLGSHYARALRDSYRAVWKEDMSPEQEYMRREGLISSSTKFTDDYEDTTVTERLMHQYGTKGIYDGKINTTMKAVKNGIDKVNDTLGKVFETSENIHKQAALRYLNEQVAKGNLDMTKDEIDIFVRTKAGSPAYLRRGTETTMINIIVPFFNAVKEGIRGDFEAYKDDKASYLTKMFTTFVLPGMALALLEEGAFDSMQGEEDDKWSDIVQAGTTEYTRNNKFVLPLSMSEDGKGFCVTIPIAQNPAIRSIYSTTRSITRAAYRAYKSGDVEGKEFMDQILEASTDILFNPLNDIPGAGPALSGGSDTYNVMKTGNYYDDYFGSPHYSSTRQDELESSLSERAREAGITALKSMATPKLITDLFEKEGVSDILESVNKVNNPSNDDDIESLSGHFRNLIGTEPGKFIFGAFLSYGRKGSDEAMYKAGKETKLHNAVIRMEARDNLTGTLKAAKEGKEYIPSGKLTPDVVASMRRQYNKALKGANPSYPMSVVLQAGNDKKKLDAAYKILRGSRSGRAFLKDHNINEGE